MVDVTLLICTRNRADTLAVALYHLAKLRIPDRLRWEVVVVDNASTDQTQEVVREIIDSNQFPCEVTLLEETTLGVAFARKRGIAASQGTWVAYVDDDCRLADDWLSEFSKFANSHPEAGAFGGLNELEWEELPSRLSRLYRKSLAGQDWGKEPQCFPIEGDRVPCGAGLVLRRDAILESGYLDLGRLISRQGKRLTSGEDTEIQLLIRQKGWEIWYAPGLRLRHYISAERDSLSYLLALHYGFGRAEPYLILLEKQLPLTSQNRLRTLGWAGRETMSVMRRFPLGFLRYKNERPTWLIRLWYALGMVKGATDLSLFYRD